MPDARLAKTRALYPPCACEFCREKPLAGRDAMPSAGAESVYEATKTGDARTPGADERLAGTSPTGSRPATDQWTPLELEERAKAGLPMFTATVPASRPLEARDLKAFDGVLQDCTCPHCTMRREMGV